MPSPARLVLLACLVLPPPASAASPPASHQAAADGEETVIDLGPTTEPSTGPHLCMVIRCWHDAGRHRHCRAQRFVGANSFCLN